MDVYCNCNSARVHPALLCANHTEQGKYIGQDMPAARTTKAIKNQVTCSLSARKGAQCGHGASFSLPPSTPKQYVRDRCCAENGADAVVLQSVDQSVLQRCRLSRQNNVGQISLANIRNMPRRLRGPQNLLGRSRFFGVLQVLCELMFSKLDVLQIMYQFFLHMLSLYVQLVKAPSPVLRCVGTS